MRLVARCRATLLAAALTCALPLGSAQAAAGTENVATATATEDNARVFDFAWDYDTQRGDVNVGHRNEAEARSQCTGCGATAIAFQVVIHSGSPRFVVPINLAEAYNYECTTCVTVAEARQFVRVYPEPVMLTDTGKAILADVRSQLRALEHQSLPAGELHAAVEAQEARVLAALRDELVLRSSPDTPATVLLQQQLLDAADLG